MKPLFLDCPPRYTRAQRGEHKPIDYACAVECYRHGDAKAYSTLWWVSMACIAIATVIVIW